MLFGIKCDSLEGSILLFIHNICQLCSRQWSMLWRQQWFRGSSSEGTVVITKQVNKHMHKMTAHCEKGFKGNKNADQGGHLRR